ncbi:MAG: methyltransferase domain-containing protein [Acidobacteriota bacterium]|nr:MAG: methyltransferase domain-containing protein [Acidobacteriota bacterium]
MALDIGTGDGRFVFRSAERDPDTFWIGVDANAKPLKKISTMAERKLGKGRRANAMFVHASAEDLPEEFKGIADEIFINFPWGSLLGAVLRPDPEFLTQILSVLKPGGRLSILTAIDPKRDQTELGRLGIEPASAHFEISIASRYASAGLQQVPCGTGSARELRAETTWAKKLKGSRQRRFVKLVFTASA